MTDERAYHAPGGLIGVIHLPALPGDPGAGEDFDAVVEAAVADAEALAAGGIETAIIENFGSVPFPKGTDGSGVEPHVVAIMTVVARECQRVGLTLGINCLRNDAAASLGIAAAVGAAFIRVNVHTGAYVTDQGIIEGEAFHTVRYRDRIDAAIVGTWLKEDGDVHRPVDSDRVRSLVNNWTA